MQNNNFAGASCFFVHFFVVTARLRRENAYFHVLWRTWTQDNNFLFLFLNFDTVFYNSTPEKKLPTFGELSATKFEAAQLYFLRDVYEAVAVVIA